MKALLHRAGLAFVLALAANAADAEEVTLAHGGLTLNANLETAGADWKQGPLVLMTHGTLAHGSMEIMEALQGALKDRDISSLSMTLSLGLDNRRGMYDCATPHTHKHTDALEEIGAWLGWLQSQGVGQVALLGHSRGGNQSARFAAAHPEAPLSAVILVAPQTWSEAYAAEDYQKRYGKELATPIEQARKLEADGKGGSLMEHVDFVYCADTSATASAFLSYHAPDPRMDTPALTVNGDVLRFPVVLKPAQRLICRSDRHWHIIDAQRTQVAEGDLTVAPPILKSGSNRVSFTCVAPERALVKLVKVYEP